ncbi:MAG: hypothetical protein FWG21_00395 [Oscillospiraceae bacterium]|nr:hypothetical protein [Oscillospiraceae bacterium]
MTHSANAVNQSKKLLEKKKHGNAQFMTVEEIERVYDNVKFGNETEVGIIVGHDKSSWLVDTSDHNLLLLTSLGGGKTNG